MGNRQEINQSKVNPVGKILLASALTLGIGGAAEACGGGGSDGNSPTPDDLKSPTANVLVTESPMPSATDMATQITEAPTIEPTPEPIQTPVEWSEENITAQIDSAMLLAETLSREINPGVELFDTALAQAKAGQTGYNQAIGTKDYSSILATVNEFSHVAYSIGDFACYETYRETEGRAFVEFRNLVRNLSSKYESLGYLEKGITQTFEQILSMPDDCTNFIMLLPSNN